MLGFGKPARPRAVAFDIIGTTFPLESLRPLVRALGLPPAGLEGWFAAALRDAFALAAAGDFAPFENVLQGALDGVLAEQQLSPDHADREAVLDGMKHLPARVGAAEAFSLLAEAEVPILAVTNGSAASTAALLKKAGLDDLVAHIVSVDEVELSKPRPEVYRRAADRAGVDPRDLALIAAHPWDINGARAAGLSTAFLSSDRPFAPVMRPPDWTADTLPDLARAMLRR